VKVCFLIAAVLPVLAGLSAAEIQQNYLDGVNYGTVLFTVSAPPVRGATPEMMAGVKESLVQCYQRSFMEQLQFEVCDVPLVQVVRTATEEKCGFVLESTVVAYSEERRVSRVRQRMMMLGRKGWTQLFQDRRDVRLTPNTGVGANPAEVPFFEVLLPLEKDILKTDDGVVTVGLKVQNNLPFDVKSFSLAAVRVTMGDVGPDGRRNSSRSGRTNATLDDESKDKFLVSFGPRVSLDVPAGKPAATTVEIPFTGDNMNRLRVQRQAHTVVIYGVTAEGKFPDGKPEEEDLQD